MNKSLLIKVSIAAVLIAAFFGYIQWTNQHFPVPDSFQVKDSMKGVMKAQYKVDPQLKLADHFHLMKNIDKTVKLPGLNRKLIIYKVWFNPDRTYLLYSISLNKGDKHPRDVPILKFSDMVLQNTKSKYVKAKINQSSPVTPGEVYRHKLYRGIFLNRGIILQPKSDPHNNGTSLENFLNYSGKITLKDARISWNNKQTGEKQKALQGLSIQNHYVGLNKEKYFSMSLNRKVALPDGNILDFHRLKSNNYYNRLYFTMKPGYPVINSINVAGSGIKGAVAFSVNQQNNQYYISLPPFTDIPKQLSIQIKGITYVTNRSIHFKVPGWNGKTSKIFSIQKKVATFLGKPTYFAGYNKEPGDKIDLQFAWKFKKDQTIKQQLFSLTPENAFEEPEANPNTVKQLKRRTTGIVSIKNDKGQKSKFASTGAQSDGQDQSITTFGNAISLKPSFVKNTKFLSITIRHMPDFEKVYNGKILIPINK